MYSNLRAEMARKNLSVKDIATVIQRTEKTARDKISGKRDFTYNETCKIRDAYFPLSSIEEIFARDKESA